MRPWIGSGIPHSVFKVWSLVLAFQRDMEDIGQCWELSSQAPFRSPFLFGVVRWDIGNYSGHGT